MIQPADVYMPEQNQNIYQIDVQRGRKPPHIFRVEKAIEEAIERVEQTALKTGLTFLCGGRLVGPGSPELPELLRGGDAGIQLRKSEYPNGKHIATINVPTHGSCKVYAPNVDGVDVLNWIE